MSDISAWEQVWRINGRFLRATFCGGFAWLCWQGYIVGIGWLGLFAAMFAVGAVIHGGIALFQTIKAIVGSLRWGRYQKLGANPKADKLAERDVLRKRGLL